MCRRRSVSVLCSAGGHINYGDAPMAAAGVIIQVAGWASLIKMAPLVISSCNK